MKNEEKEVVVCLYDYWFRLLPFFYDGFFASFWNAGAVGVMVNVCSYSKPGKPTEKGRKSHAPRTTLLLP